MRHHGDAAKTMNFFDEPQENDEQQFQMYAEQFQLDNEGTNIFDEYINEEEESFLNETSNETFKSKSSGGSSGKSINITEERRRKNRLAARKSRERRLSHIADLEATVSRYRHQISVLSLKLQAANVRLAQLEFTRNVPVTPPNSLTEVQINEIVNEYLEYPEQPEPLKEVVAEEDAEPPQKKGRKLRSGKTM